MIIDFHQHYLPFRPSYPGEVAQDWLYADSRIQGYRDVGRLLADMDEAAVDQVVWQGEYLVAAQHCRQRNMLVREACRAAPHRLAAYASLQPNDADAIEALKAALDEGFVGVGELNPAAQHFSMRDQNARRLFEYCAQWAIPVLIHVNEPVGPAYMGKTRTPLLSAYEIAARYPELPIILAHWGGGLWWYEQIPAVKRVLKNVWYDTAASFFTYPNTPLMAQMAALVVPDKIVFGSDYPLHPVAHPEGWLRLWTDTMRHACPASCTQAWMGGNAARLLMPVWRTEPRPTVVGQQLPLTAATPIMVIAEEWPERFAILERWGITCTELTPWWQTIAHALSESGHGPEIFERVMADVTEGL
jgi:predicted TIM-barrel fold metal-dependent hydrolase